MTEPRKHRAGKNHRERELPPREIGYGGYEGRGTRLCPCRGYVLGIFRFGELTRVELHHLGRGHQEIERLDVADWRVPIGPVKIKPPPDEEPKRGLTRQPSRSRRNTTPDGRERRR